MKPMPFPAPPPESLALTILRRARGLTGIELADLAGMTKGKLSRYEMGTDGLHRGKLDELASMMGYEPADVDSVLFGIRAATARREEVPLSPVGPTPAERRRIREVVGQLAQAEREGLEELFVRHLRETRARLDRNEAKDLVRWLLEEPDVMARRELLKASQQFHKWAVAEWLCDESEKAAASSAANALELARLALRAAELAPGDPVWSQRLQGYVWIFIANARRVCGDMPGAVQGFENARHLWEAGVPADPGLLAAWRLPDGEASLRRQGDPARALELHDEAMVLAPPEAKGRILLNKALTLEQNGKPDLALATLLEARAFLDVRDSARLACVLRFNLTVILCDLGRFEEAEEAVAEVVELVTEIGNELDLVRLLWLRGRIDAGLGRERKAEAAFEQVREAFRERGIAYDFAKITLELAVLLSNQGRVKEVKALAQQTAWIFNSQGVHSEAEKALRLFIEAADAERLTVEFARRILGYLNRAEKGTPFCFEA
jgi:tetratricopeptide (TPR) repeat protein